MGQYSGFSMTCSSRGTLNHPSLRLLAQITGWLLRITIWIKVGEVNIIIGRFILVVDASSNQDIGVDSLSTWMNHIDPIP